MHKNLFDKVNIRPEAIHLPDGTNPDAADACKKYNDDHPQRGRHRPAAAGLGPNGHIGFNEPDDHFSKGTHCVDLTESTIQPTAACSTASDDVPVQAYTMVPRPSCMPA